MLTMFSCASDDAPSDGQDTVGVSLAFNVSTNRGETRMSDQVTQQKGNYRGIKDEGLYLFPFDIKDVIGLNKDPLTGNVFHPNRVGGTYHYLDEHALDVRIGTASFLSYAQAKLESDDKFVNGSIEPTIPAGKPNTSAISFAPEQIYTVKENDIPKIDEKATAIAAYLTDVANAIKEQGKSALYQQFINSEHPVACSSTNVANLAAWVSDNEINLSSVTSTYDNDYPSCLSLPDGAAVVKWNENKFEPWTVTTTEVNINRLDRFVYPAELWYYSNSRIKTSTKNQKDYYTLTKWSDVLDKYETVNGEIDVNVRSVAIIEPLSYAVGCLQIGLVASSTLTDADENPKTITLSAGTGEGEDATFPLTAVFVSGQHTQSYDFTATNDDEKIIYDKEITGISMGTATTASLSTATPTAYTNTLVFQTKDGENIRFALEFENNSGQDFKGCNGIVFAGTKFYLVGTIEVPVGQTDDWKKRAFTKGYTTQGTVRISSLKQAYTYLPDLLDPRLEIGIKLVPNWIQSTTTNVPL
jgi:hypothetical protein